MTPPIVSLHHVTATVDRAQPDLDCYAGTLGLRLVKRTVNFDNHDVFHFYYGDRVGSPGTIWTTFPYHGMRVRQGVHGAGQIVATSFSVPRDSLAHWEERLGATRGPDRFGAPTLAFHDPSGLAIELIESDDAREPWRTERVPERVAVRGLHGVTLAVRRAGPTVEFLAGLGFSPIGREGQRVRLGIGEGRPEQTLDVLETADLPDGVNGLGTVHHVALAITDAEAQRALRETLVERGVRVTEIRDRQYFTSIYFREPGGVLLEVATVGPGFGVDEPVDRLGQALKLPPWEEPHRAAIEAALPDIVVP
ncbi:MAG: ring-cleaving dioxygenase [Gemmatimonadales bacterium]